MEINFPLYIRNKKGDTYTCYFTAEKFEQITISKAGESFRGSILFGFNEQYFELQKDLQSWYSNIFRVHDLIEAFEYELIFQTVMQGREEFFTKDNYEHIEIVHPLTPENQTKYIKHKWKPLENLST